MIIPPSITPEGFNVPVSHTFTGIKILSFLSLANNSANPNLTLYTEHFTYKVLKTSSANYSEIEKVGADYNAFMQSLTLDFNNSLFTVTFSMNHLEDLKELLKFFRQKSISFSEKAQHLMK